MKKILFVSAVSLMALACGSGGDKKAESAPASETQAPAASTAANADEKGLDIIAALDCTTCHAINEKKIGPAYMDVSKKYQATDAVIDSLAHKVIDGGKGVWGEVPMTPHPNLSLDSAKEAVRYILNLKNEQ